MTFPSKWSQARTKSVVTHPHVKGFIKGNFVRLFNAWFSIVHCTVPQCTATITNKLIKNRPHHHWTQLTVPGISVSCREIQNCQDSHWYNLYCLIKEKNNSLGMKLKPKCFKSYFLFWSKNNYATKRIKNKTIKTNSWHYKYNYDYIFYSLISVIWVIWQGQNNTGSYQWPDTN